jgi:hypothetical protein
MKFYRSHKRIFSKNLITIKKTISKNLKEMEEIVLEAEERGIAAM